MAATGHAAKLRAPPLHFKPASLPVFRRLKFAPLISPAVLAACAALLALTPACGGTAATLAALDSGLVVIRLAEGEDPKSLDPHKTGDVISSRHAGMCYDCLLQYDYLARPAALIPCLAAEMPVFDRASNTYTFKLREDVYFADDRCFHPDARGKSYAQEGDWKQTLRGKGRKFVAADMVYSFKRLAALPDSEGYWILEGKVAGLDAFHNKVVPLKDKNKGSPDPDDEWREAMKLPVAGLRAPDEHTFVVQLTEPYPQFLYAITLNYGAAMAHEAADYYGAELVRKPVGTGAFILSRWRFSSEIVYERNPNYRDERFPASDLPEHAPFKALMGKRLPIADRVVFSVIKESQPQFLEFLQGNLDATGLDKDQFSAAVTPQSDITPALASRGIGLIKADYPGLSYISFNMNDGLVGYRGGARALALRKAISLCIDREDYIRRYRNGRGIPASQLIPPYMFGYFEASHMPTQRHDPAQGRRLLQQAGFRLEQTGPETWRALDPDTGRQPTINVLLRRTTSAMRDYAVFLKSSGAKIGVNIECELMQFSEFLKRQNEGTGQAYDAGWVMDYPDAQNMLQLLYGPNKPPGINSASYASEEYDALYKEMAALYEDVPEQRARKGELIIKMHAVLERDTPWVLRDFARTFILHHDWHKLPEPNEFAYTYFKFMHSDSEKRGSLSVSWAHMPLWPAALMLLALLLPAGMMTWRMIRQA